jgi:ABC-type sugar transport system ATPase subunit
MKKTDAQKKPVFPTTSDNNQPVVLEVKDVNKRGEGDFMLSNISFRQTRLEKIAISGETGAGKSTLLKLIAGLLQPDSGQLLYQNEKILGPLDHLVPGHPGIAYLSQHFELQKSLRVEQVLNYANTMEGDEAETLYKVCQIDHLLRRRTDQLSGGEKQRVAICRLLISRPGLLLLDEPFSHLDMVHKNTLKDVIRDIGERLRITCMLVSHDPIDTLSWADKIIVMREGRVVQMDSPEIIYSKPVDEYTAGLFGKYNLIAPKDGPLYSRLKMQSAMSGNGQGRRIFLRPEQLKMAARSERAFRGKIERVLFYGSFSEAIVSVSKKHLTIRTTRRNIQDGQTIYFTVSREKLWNV